MMLYLLVLVSLIGSFCWADSADDFLNDLRRCADKRTCHFSDHRVVKDALIWTLSRDSKWVQYTMTLAELEDLQKMELPSNLAQRLNLNSGSNIFCEITSTNHPSFKLTFLQKLAESDSDDQMYVLQATDATDEQRQDLLKFIRDQAQEIKRSINLYICDEAELNHKDFYDAHGFSRIDDAWVVEINP